MYDNEYNSLSMFDGICDQTRKLRELPDDEKWDISSSGKHMFVDFVIGNSYPGFSANIHFGNKNR